VVDEAKTLCPSAQPQMEGAAIFGVVTKGESGPRVAYLNAKVSATDPRFASVPEGLENSVLRVAARCVESACVHFNSGRCGLASRVAAELDTVVDRLPACAIRRNCRWYAQEGASACMRCPQVVTSPMGYPDLERLAVGKGRS
jgi:hypothetical protein